jgi:ubiquinone/menaquinone biosynthesis C-methylase UbiE
MFLVYKMRWLKTIVGTQNRLKREDWLETTIKKIPAGARILDAGAGEQKYKHFCSDLYYVAQDFAKYNGKGNGKGLQKGKWNQPDLDIISDICNIPEPKASFDAVMCVEVFEHISNPMMALKEFNRLLKPGGYLILTAPFCSLTHFAPYYFFSGFSRYFYETHLEKWNFEIIDLQENGNFFEYLAQEIRRVSSVAGMYCNANLKISERLAIKIVLKMLQRFSDNESGSSELLCFGHHVFARKRI